MAQDPFSQIYHRLADEYPDVYDGPLLAPYVRLLVAADQSYPTRARWSGLVSRGSLKRLEACGLVSVDGARYEVRGMVKKRESTSEAARKAATMRWDSGRIQSDDAGAMRTHSGRNADPMPNRIEKSRVEESTSAREGLPNITTEVQEEGETITGQGILTAGDKQLTELDRLCEVHGDEAIVKAFRRVANGEAKSWRQLVWDSMKVLEPFATAQDTQQADDAETEAADKERWRKSMAANKQRAEDLGMG